jgi:hypothetical protein
MVEEGQLWELFTLERDELLVVGVVHIKSSTPHVLCV